MLLTLPGLPLVLNPEGMTVMFPLNWNPPWGTTSKVRVSPRFGTAKRMLVVKVEEVGAPLGDWSLRQKMVAVASAAWLGLDIERETIATMDGATMQGATGENRPAKDNAPARMQDRIFFIDASSSRLFPGLRSEPLLPLNPALKAC